MLENAVIQNMRFRFASLDDQQNYCNNNDIDVGNLALKHLPTKPAILCFLTLKWIALNLGRQWLSPALVSVVMTCCVAYTDKLHLHGTADAISRSTRLVFPSLSLLLTPFVPVSISILGIYSLLLSGAPLTSD